ncbi:MAG: hypothetical protein AB7E51_08415 [Pseudodesulfovibrio sp.]|uniref:hypothetical protein n=1 Tax=Pseudodesulfovibrio sp. TaxID=2035812 RepID=UPI003D152E33
MGFFDFLLKRGNEQSQKKRSKPHYTIRETVTSARYSNASDKVVFDAWTSGDLKQMLDAVDLKVNLIDRHHLLQCIVSETYRQRKDDVMRQKCIEISKIHIAEFPQIAQTLRREHKTLPHISTFQHYATVLTENGNYDEAISVCNTALGYELHDGTQSGFEGRIERIKKKAQRA